MGICDKTKYLRLHAPDKPVLLIYGYNDVHRVNPVNEWEEET